MKRSALFLTLLVVEADLPFLAFWMAAIALLAAAPLLAPVVTAISSGLAPIILASEPRMRTGGSNHRESSTWWGNFFASSDRSTAPMDTRGMTACPAVLR